MPTTLCFVCAYLFDPHEGESLTCPECGYSIPSERYELIRSYAERTSTYGYHYRIAYEDQLSRGEITQQYQLSPHEVWTFCAIAALSGIVGNAAYDLVKAVIARIAANLSTDKPREAAKAKRLAEDDELLRQFMISIADYADGMKSLDPRLRDAIREEIICDVFGNLALSASLQHAGPDHPDLHDLVRDASRQALSAVKDPPQLSEHLFEGMWSRFE